MNNFIITSDALFFECTLVVIDDTLYLNAVFCLGGAFFGQNVEIFIGDDVEGEHRGTLCAYGPTSDPQSEYVIHCFSGAMSGRVITIKDRFTGSLKLCDVQVLGG